MEGEEAAEQRRREVGAEEHGEEQRRADDVRPGLVGDPSREGLAPGVGDPVGPPVAGAGLPGGDEAGGLEAAQLAVDVARGDVPELPDRVLSGTGELPAGHRPAMEEAEEGGRGRVRFRELTFPIIRC